MTKPKQEHDTPRRVDGATIEPCTTCSDGIPEIDSWENYDGRAADKWWQVFCQGCHRRGPESASRVGALEAWAAEKFERVPEWRHDKPDPEQYPEIEFRRIDGVVFRLVWATPNEARGDLVRRGDAYSCINCDSERWVLRGMTRGYSDYLWAHELKRAVGRGASWRPARPVDTSPSRTRAREGQHE